MSIEALAVSCLRTRSFELQPFLDAMAALPMAFEELFALYIGKNMLNRFRQNNGYKTGEYRKLWSGREDNEHLIELLEELNVPAAELPEALYDARCSLQRRLTMRPTLQTPWQEAWQPEFVGTLLFLVDRNRVLLIEKKTGHGMGKINAPGGKWDIGESLMACARREMLEETVSMRNRWAVQRNCVLSNVTAPSGWAMCLLRNSFPEP